MLFKVKGEDGELTVSVTLSAAEIVAIVVHEFAADGDWPSDIDDRAEQWMNDPVAVLQTVLKYVDVSGDDGVSAEA